MKTNLNFDHKETKKLLSKLDFEFFLKQNIEKEKYEKIDIDKIYSSYKTTSIQIKTKGKDNKKQFYYYTEGQVRKMFTGGLLTSLFELDENRGVAIGNFLAVGDNWAYFSYWQKRYKRKIKAETVWEIVIKTGSILAIILTILKVWSVLY